MRPKRRWGAPARADQPWVFQNPQLGRATELFLEGVAAGAAVAMRGVKRKAVKYSDVEAHVLRLRKYEFLHGAQNPRP